MTHRKWYRWQEWCHRHSCGTDSDIPLSSRGWRCHCWRVGVHQSLGTWSWCGYVQRTVSTPDRGPLMSCRTHWRHPRAPTWPVNSVSSVSPKQVPQHFWSTFFVYNKIKQILLRREVTPLVLYNDMMGCQQSCKCQRCWNWECWLS